MIDTNAPVKPLPDFDAIEWEMLSPKYPFASMIQGHLSLLPLVLIALGIIFFVFWHTLEPYLHWFWLFLPLWWLWAVYRWLSAKYQFYAVRERDINFSYGIIFKTTIIQPVTRLQHIEISKNMVERWFNLATLQLYSAGGSSHAIAISGLAEETAEQLRTFIINNRALDNEF